MHKSIIFLLLFVARIFYSEGQISIEWQRCYGGTANDNGVECVIQTFDGGYAFVSDTRSSNGDVTGFHQGGTTIDDAWVVKTDSIGNIEWQLCLGGSDDEKVNSIIQCADSGFAILSHTRSEDGNVDSMAFNNKTWLVKLSPTGIIEWQNAYDIVFVENVTGEIIKITDDAGFILTGMLYSLDYDLAVLKLDSIGTIIWQQNLGGSRMELVHTVLKCDDGGYLITADTQSQDGDVNGWHADSTWDNDSFVWVYSFDYWVVKLDSLGNLEWQKCYGGTDDEIAWSTIKTNDGGYVICGHTFSVDGDMTDTFAPYYYGSWVVKIDSVGNIQWNRKVLIQGVEIIQTNDGSYRIFGSWNSQFVICKLDSSGNTLWVGELGSQSPDYGFCGIQSSDGSFLMGGLVQGNSGDVSGLHGGADSWLVKFNENANMIRGKLFVDINSNNVQDAGEIALDNKLVTETITGETVFTDDAGNYLVSISDTGNFQITTPTINYYAPNPVVYNVSFNSLSQIDSLNDFAFQPTSVINDLCLSISPVSLFHSGFDASYMIHYSNVGTTVLNPTVIFYPDNNLNFLSSNPTQSSSSVDSVVWNFGPLNPFQSGQILVTVNVNAGLPIGTLLNSGATIEPIAGDANTICNHSFWEVFTTGSMDPNDIQVNHDTLTTTEVANGQFLDYIIRFQNTGNDTAFTAKILNSIDTNLFNLNSFEFLNSSHPLNITWYAWGGNMELKFDNILLPDSSTNEPLSHGFIRYRIQPKNTLNGGDSITNFAAIYFDFNNPVMTNIAVTNIILPTSVNEHSEHNILIYPNPFNDEITIELKEVASQELSVELYNIYGQKVRNLYSGSTDSEKWKNKYDVSDLSKGVYILIISDKEYSTQKIIKL